MSVEIITNDSDKEQFNTTIAYMVKRLVEPVVNAALGLQVKRINTSVMANPMRGVALQLTYVFDDPRPGHEGEERHLDMKSPVVPMVGFGLLCDTLHVFERLVLDGLPMALQIADGFNQSMVPDEAIVAREEQLREEKPASKLILPT